MAPRILFHVLAKDKSAVLPYWLEQNLERLNYPKDRVTLFIRTNNNRDNTKDILSSWIKTQTEWESIIYDDTDVSEQVQKYDIHEWNSERFSVIGRLRQEGIQKAIDMNMDFYFVCDVDNFLIPSTLQTLVNENKPVIAPFLRYAIDNMEPNVGYNNNYYSNFHFTVTPTGYFVQSQQYIDLVDQRVKGVISVGVAHCTYLIHKSVLSKTRYNDGSGEYEYIIVAREFRKQGVEQYLDNRKIYGYLTLCENVDSCKKWMATLK